MERYTALSAAIESVSGESSHKIPKAIVNEILLFARDKCYECGLDMHNAELQFNKEEYYVGGICSVCCTLNDYDTYISRECQWCKELTIQKGIWTGVISV